ncbi:MAG: endonuclease MutS2, partial [Anaerolineae bacterium]|nr:endonuclease MutS2 [Anaerolineae bacterium]
MMLDNGIENFLMIPEKTLQTLELDKILDKIATFTTFSGGEELVRGLFPTTDLTEAQIWQKETAEARLLFENKTNVTLGGVRDVREISQAAARGIIIDPPILQDIRNTLRRGMTIKRILGRMKATYPLLGSVAEMIEECVDLQDAIGNVLDDNNEVKDSASPKLAIIRRDLKIAFERLQSKLQRILSTPTKAQYLQE